MPFARKPSRKPARRAARPRANPPFPCRRTPKHNKYVGAIVTLYGQRFEVTGCFKMPGSREYRYRATNLRTGEGTTLSKAAVAGLAARAPARVVGRRVTRRKPPSRRRDASGRFV